MSEPADQVTCKRCGTATDPLAVFPGTVCLACWAASPEGRRMPTADELVAMWGGPVRQSAAESLAAEFGDDISEWTV